VIAVPRPAGPLDPEVLHMAAIRGGALRDRPVTVLGLARTGVALARFLADAGARVTIYDGRPAGELTDAIEALGDRPVTLALGPTIDPAASWAGAALVATSPSITPDYPTTEPGLRAALQALRAARTSGDLTAPALVSEADLFLRLCPAPTIGVTGTKGKTTTASLIAAILAADPAHPVVLGGNIGIPLIERLWELTPEHRVVIELSELQLPTLSRGTTVAVYTNVTSDHLDRHGSLEDYRRVKRRLAELTRARGGFLVLNDDDRFVRALEHDYLRPMTGWPGQTITRYRLGGASAGGVGLIDGRIFADGAGWIMPAAELQVPGRHSISNALAAISVGLHFGIAPEAIRDAAASFAGVEHRLELVALIDGVRFVNDSQGTQPDAVIAALRAFDGPIVLIAGGRDKAIDLRSLAPVVAERAIAAVLIGESGPTLGASFRAAGLSRTERADDLDDAVRRADGLAREAIAAAGPGAEPATVLLSPAAASFDMFPDYAARGRAFKVAVTALAAARQPTQEGR
jgi:UDP-N-acetylmuramoylalanine--D-glutamate ligase